MSDTPKTDAETSRCYVIDSESYLMCRVDFARTIERELTESKATIERLTRELEEARKDAGRLDYVLFTYAFLNTGLTDAGVHVFQLMAQDENEELGRLSGDGFHKSPRAAIDAAMASQPLPPPPLSSEQPGSDGPRSA